MRNRLVCGALVFALSSVVWADADDNRSATLTAAMSGPKEIPVNLSTGTGNVTVRVTEAPASISITISYSKLTGDAMAAHLHLGNQWESGPIVVPICGTAGRTCPAQGTEQTFTFPLTGNAITAIPAQRFTADVATLIRALESGVIYANVHTAAFPNGEIRGQLGHGRGRASGVNPGRGNGNGKNRDE
jgi:hypothetical protein